MNASAPLRFALALGGALQAGLLLAQPVPDPTRPLERPAPLPELRPPPEAPRLRLPPVPPVQREAPLSAGMRVFVTRFRIEGNTVFSEDELRGLLSDLEGRQLDNAGLEEARTRLTRHYIERGYINSGAVIPDQKVEGGVVALRVIEGRLTAVTVGGENTFRERYLRGRAMPPAERPLNIQELQERIQIMLQNPQIERVNAELGPGLRPGEAHLRLDVKEAPWREVGYSYANNRPPSIGMWRHELRGALRNFTGWGEQLDLRWGRTEGLDDGAVALAIPVTRRDTLLWGRIERNSSLVVEEPFHLLDIAAETESLEIGVRHPVWRTLAREVALGAALSRRHTETFLLGQPFSFSPGLTDGRSTVSALRLSAEWIERSTDHVIAARIGWNRGISAFGATELDDAPDSRFATRTLQLQFARRLASRAQVLLRFDGQHASENLLTSEKFAVGGAESVRGYRENLLVRDVGWSASAEYRHPLARVPLTFFSDSSELGWISVAPFVDAGHAHDRGESGPGTRTLWSLGAGLRWDVAPGTLLSVYKGYAMKDVPAATSSLQDRGIHVRFSVQKAF